MSVHLESDVVQIKNFGRHYFKLCIEPLQWRRLRFLIDYLLLPFRDSLGFISWSGQKFVCQAGDFFALTNKAVLRYQSF